MSLRKIDEGKAEFTFGDAPENAASRYLEIQSAEHPSLYAKKTVSLASATARVRFGNATDVRVREGYRQEGSLGIDWGDWQTLEGQPADVTTTTLAPPPPEPATVTTTTEAPTTATTTEAPVTTTTTPLPTTTTTAAPKVIRTERPKAKPVSPSIGMPQIPPPSGEEPQTPPTGP